MADSDEDIDELVEKAVEEIFVEREAGERTNVAEKART
jgi:hypothetical protein